jgi:glycosyltransferase involved in cell wall biosynthesis
MIHILQISNDFGGTEVYRNLYQHLDNIGVKQTIFVPLNPRVLYRKGNHDFKFKTEGSKIIYSVTQKWYHRYLYSNKITAVVKDLEKLVDLDEISLIHTNALCMTGAVAFEISKKNKKPYIVSVRNTDINEYFKKMWWKKNYFYKVLTNASSLIFISPQYKKNCFERYFDQSIVSKVVAKTKVIPNAIDSYYLKNRQKIPKTLHNPIEIVFAGGFRDNKNLLSLIQAVEMLKNKKFEVKLTAIGRSLPNRKVSDNYIDLLDKAVEGKDYIYLVDYKEKEELCEVYNNSDIFVMPSIHETFGLSYVEALSQGLPIVYTKGQGFDGFYEDGEVGFAVNALNIKDIARGIECVIENYPNLAQNVVNLQLSKYFDWNEIAKEYLSLYNTILEDKNNI